MIKFRRAEDPRLLIGGGRYTDDIVLPGMLHGIVPRSPHAAAMINRIDTAKAASVPGVKAIYTAADMTGLASTARSSASARATPSRLGGGTGGSRGLVSLRAAQSNLGHHCARTDQTRLLRSAFPATMLPPFRYRAHRSCVTGTHPAPRGRNR